MIKSRKYLGFRVEFPKAVVFTDAEANTYITGQYSSVIA